MVESAPPVSVDSSDGSLVGLITVAVAVAVTVGTDCAVTPPISTRAEQQCADKQCRQDGGGQRQVSKAPLLRRSLNRLRSKDLLFRELRTLVSTSAKYRRDCRHLYCVVMLWAGRRCVGLLGIGSHRLNLAVSPSSVSAAAGSTSRFALPRHRWFNLGGVASSTAPRFNLGGIALLNIGSHRLNLGGIALPHIGSHRLNLGGIALLHFGNRRLNQPPQCRLNFA